MKRPYKFKPLIWVLLHRSDRGNNAAASIGIYCDFCHANLPYSQAVEQGWLSTTDRQVPVLYKCKQCNNPIVEED